MKIINNNIVLFVLLTMIPLLSHSAWTPFHHITGNYYNTYPAYNVITIVLDTSFHTCGDQSSTHWGSIKNNEVGADAYKMYGAVILSAWVSNKPVSLNVDGCGVNRAKIIGVRIGN